MEHTVVIENDPRAKAAIERWGEGKSDPERSRFETDCSDIARLIRPQRGGFSDDIPSDRTLEKPLSSSPILAQSSFAAGIYASITNPANRWAGLETPDREFNKWKPMAEWNDLVTTRVLNSFRPSMSSFYTATFQAYSDIAAFGNAAGYDEVDEVEKKFIDVTMSLSEVVVWIDFHGRVVEVVRKFHLTPQAAILHFGSDNLPQKMRDMAIAGSSGKIAFYQHVKKNFDFKTGKLGPRGKRWLSHYACEVESSLVRRKGYSEMPFYFPRWDVDSGMKYGTGPGFVALASARVNQQMTGAVIRQAQKAADPTLLAPDRHAYPLDGVVRPGEVLYGGTNMQGNPVVRALDNFGSISVTDAERRQIVEDIKEVFQYSIMGLQGRTGVTAEETRIMEEARLRNWAPHADRIMEEYAARKVERRFRMLWRAGQLPPPPPEAENMPLQVRYQSGAAMAMSAREGQAVRQFLTDLGPLAQMDPRYADRLDPDAIAEALHDASPSLPASVLRSREDADAIAQDRAEQQQQAQQMAALQSGSSAAKDMAQAAGALPEGTMEAMSQAVQ